MKYQENNTLFFLDTNIDIVNNKMETSIYRKLTFSGLGLSFLLFIPIPLLTRCSKLIP